MWSAQNGNWPLGSHWVKSATAPQCSESRASFIWKYDSPSHPCQDLMLCLSTDLSETPPPHTYVHISWPMWSSRVSYKVFCKCQDPSPGPMGMENAQYKLCWDALCPGPPTLVNVRISTSFSFLPGLQAMIWRRIWRSLSGKERWMQRPWVKDLTLSLSPHVTFLCLPLPHLNDPVITLNPPR